jgi:hypothetical protein
MKQLFIAAVLLCSLCVAHAAIVSSNLYTLATVNNATNTGTAVLLGTTTLPTTTFALQSVGTGGTNFGGTGVIMFGHTTNTSQMIQVGSYNFTNDTIVSFTITNNGVIPAYFAYQAVNIGNTNMQQSAQAIQQK